MCKIIAIANQKGGVAKTTTTINLGVGLSKVGKRVMLIDADPQGHLTMGLGFPKNLRVTLKTMMENIIMGLEFDPREAILHHEEGIDVIPSNKLLSGMDMSLFTVEDREKVLKEYLELLENDYDYILIDCMDNATSILMVFNKKECIQDIATVSELKLPIVDRIVNYFVNKGNTNLMEFPLFEIEDNIITIPSLFIVNDWQFTVINGHYAKEKVIKNREKTLSIVTEGRIEETLKNVTNIAVSKTWPYSYTDNDGKIQCSDIDFAIYDKIRNVILVIEAKWIDKHYEDEIDKRYGKILNTLNSIFSKQIKKHREFLSKRENIDLLFKDDKRYVQSEEFPTIYYLAVDKRNQMHIDDRHMVSEYMIIYFLKKYINNNELDLSTLWDEISRLKTKFEYITISSDYHEVKVGDDTVLIEKADLYLND